MRGTALPTGALAGARRVASEYGESPCTLRVMSESVGPVGTGRAETAPCSRLSMPLLAGLAAGASPRPLSTKIWLLSRLNIAPVGYQPVGMKPRTMLSALLLTSTSATSLLSAFETSSVRPSGDSASELGVAVGGAAGDRLIEIDSIESRDIVSYTHTVDV